MIKKLLAASALALFAASVFAGNNWHVDFEKAKNLAKEENKNILLDFTGSDWCGWCIKLDEEVFDKTAFKDYAKENLVLVEIDFPRSKEQSAETKAQNERLLQQFGVRGFPTIVILNSQGQKIAETGYRPGGAANYVAHLKNLISSKS